MGNFTNGQSETAQCVIPDYEHFTKRQTRLFVPPLSLFVEPDVGLKGQKKDVFSILSHNAMGRDATVLLSRDPKPSLEFGSWKVAPNSISLI